MTTLFSPPLAFLALLLLLATTVRAAMCRPGQSYLSFFLRFDAHPEETAYRLECDGAVEFQRRTSEYVGLDRPRQPPTVHERRCIDAAAQTCYLTVADSAADGLEQPGLFRLYVGGEPVLHYHDHRAFDEITVCFGASCPPAPQGGADSSASCQDVVFTLFLDEFPEEISHKLVCDGDLVWNVPEGTYLQADALAIRQEHAACVDPSRACWLTVTDSYGDGLMAGPGRFALMHGPDTVAHYDGGGAEDEAAFSQVSYCFGGPACDSGGGDGDDTAATDAAADCSVVSLNLTLDEFPHEVGYQLECGDEMVWDVPAGTYLADQQFETFSKTACIAECCTFRILDTHGDGLTSLNENDPGSFELQMNGDRVAVYSGAGADADYAELEYSLAGASCDEEGTGSNVPLR